MGSLMPCVLVRQLRLLRVDLAGAQRRNGLVRAPQSTITHHVSRKVSPMKNHRSWTVLTACILALFALHCNQPPPDTRAADEASIRAINPIWFKSYNTGDVNSIVALYAEDAVLNPPGAPPARGQAAIRDYLTKDAAGSNAAGVTLNGTPTPDAGVSGDLGWESGTFTVTDKSGATVDRGKYLSVYARKNGKWYIVRDIWNSDGPMQSQGTK
jgi:ketosteroid isomerase-like protein